MTVKEFLENVKKAPGKVQSINFMMDLCTLLEEFDTMSCSTLVGKIRAQTAQVSQKDIPETDLIDLSALADKYDATLSEAYGIQFDELVASIAKDTSRSISEVKGKAKDYRAKRGT